MLTKVNPSKLLCFVKNSLYICSVRYIIKIYNNMKYLITKNTFKNIGNIKKALDDDCNINDLEIENINVLSNDFNELNKFINFCYKRNIQIYNKSIKASLITDKNEINPKFFTDILINSNFDKF